MPKLYGTGCLILSREKPVNVAYVIWRWQVASLPTQGVQPVGHDYVLADGLLAVAEDCGPDNTSGLLQFEDGAEYTVTLARQSNPAVWEFHIQPVAGALAGWQPPHLTS